MEEKMKTLIIDYVEGNLSGELKEFVTKSIETKDEWKKEYEQLKTLANVINKSSELVPDESLKKDFEAMLLAEMEKEYVNDTKTIVWGSQNRWMQAAAAVAILVVGVLVGKVITVDNRNDELQALKEEMKATKQLVISSLENQSASTRLNAMNVSYAMSSLDDEMVNVLIKTMNTDPNANVRLAAVDALSRFTDQESVKLALINSLSIQDQPMVQIALINLMIQLKEGRAVESLKKIIESKETPEVVKEEANFGVYKLS